MQLQTTSYWLTDKVSRIIFKYFILVITVCTMLFSSCDDSFQPLQENNIYNFSISGYLDVSADTQWVRVGTIRQSIDEPPNPEGIQVTLEDIHSGETVIMNDSVFTSKNVLNYWTTMNIEQEQTYRITAEQTDGKKSAVTVTTPKEIPSIFITINNGTPVGANIRINDIIEHIADLQSVWYVILNPGTENRRRIYRFPLRNTLRQSEIFGDSFAFADWNEQRKQIEQSVGGTEIEIASRQFFVAAGGPEWDDSLSSIDDLEYFLDGTASYVENGLGYVVGISSGWYPQVTCLTLDRSNYAPCEPREPFWYHE
ncbi:hypothetical protein [Rhodohalobacter sp. 8-1]|uniref:hypothetical protein n=1 Tax=Rhodohalobacter sp. 8-1 TaxID=3131972 RepID=UPI0030EC8E92